MWSWTLTEIKSVSTVNIEVVVTGLPLPGEWIKDETIRTQSLLWHSIVTIIVFVALRRILEVSVSLWADEVWLCWNMVWTRELSVGCEMSMIAELHQLREWNLHLLQQVVVIHHQFRFIEPTLSKQHEPFSLSLRCRKSNQVTLEPGLISFQYELVNVSLMCVTRFAGGSHLSRLVFLADGNTDPGLSESNVCVSWAMILL